MNAKKVNKPLPHNLFALKQQKNACEYLRLSLRRNKGVSERAHLMQLRDALHHIAEAYDVQL